MIELGDLTFEKKSEIALYSIGVAIASLSVITDKQILDDKLFQFATLTSFLLAFVQFASQAISDMKSKSGSEEAAK